MAVSALTTTVLLAVGVLLLTPLQPVLASPVVETAASHVLPALFGCLALGVLGDDVGGGVIVHKRLLGAVIPFVLCVVLYLAMPEMYNNVQGIIMIVCIPLVYKISKVLYKKGVSPVTMPEDTDTM